MLNKNDSSEISPELVQDLENCVYILESQGILILSVFSKYIH